MNASYILEISDEDIKNKPIWVAEYECLPNINVGDTIIDLQSLRQTQGGGSLRQYFENVLGQKRSTDLKITVKQKSHSFTILEKHQIYIVRLAVTIFDEEYNMYCESNS